MRHVVIDTPLQHLRINVHARGGTVFSTLHPSGAHQGRAAKVFAHRQRPAFAQFSESAIKKLHFELRCLYATLVEVVPVGVFCCYSDFWHYLGLKNPHVIFLTYYMFTIFILLYRMDNL